MTDETEKEPRLLPTFEEVAKNWLVDRGIPEESITPEMIAQEKRDVMERMEQVGREHDRAMANLRAAPVPASFANSQSRHTSFEAVMEHLYWYLRHADGREMKVDYPDHLVGINIADTAALFELDPDKCRRSVEASGYSVHENGLIMDHPSYNHFKNFFRQRFDR